MRRAIVCAVVALGLGSGAVHAEWKGKAEAGLVVARGNTETTTANAKVDLAKDLVDWKHNFYLAGLYAKSEVVTDAGDEEQQVTAERYETRWQSDWKFTERAFWFGGVRYEDDEFSGFEYQASATTGLGYRFIETDRTKLTAQLGTGYRRLKDAETGEETGNVVGRGDVAFEYKLTDNTKIIDKFIVEAGSDNTFLGNDISLEVMMTDRFALSVGYGVRYNSDPPPDLKTTDTLTTVNLVYTL